MLYFYAPNDFVPPGHTEPMTFLIPMSSKRSKLFDTYFKLQVDNDTVERLNDRKYQLGNIGVSYRTITHWTAYGLLDDPRPDGRGWRKYSLNELVWIQIVNELREIGLPLQRIKSYKHIFDVRDVAGFVELRSWFTFNMMFALEHTEEVYLYLLADGQAQFGTLEELSKSEKDIAARSMVVVNLSGFIRHVDKK